jgi:hypothetical protein
MPVGEGFRNAWRYGHTDDFAYLFTDDIDGIESYLIGVLSNGLVVTLVSSLWPILLLLWKCMGKKRVSMWSGIPYDIPHHPHAKWDSSPPILLKSRIIFCLSGIFIIISTLILVFKGIPKFQDALYLLNKSTTVSSPRLILKKPWAFGLHLAFCPFIVSCLGCTISFADCQ